MEDSDPQFQVSGSHGLFSVKLLKFSLSVNQKRDFFLSGRIPPPPPSDIKTGVLNAIKFNKGV